MEEHVYEFSFTEEGFIILNETSSYNLYFYRIQILLLQFNNYKKLTDMLFVSSSFFRSFILLTFS
jgi:hypothetical protein